MSLSRANHLLQVLNKDCRKLRNESDEDWRARCVEDVSFVEGNAHAELHALGYDAEVVRDEFVLVPLGQTTKERADDVARANQRALDVQRRKNEFNARRLLQREHVSRLASPTTEADEVAMAERRAALIETRRMEGEQDSEQFIGGDDEEETLADAAALTIKKSKTMPKQCEYLGDGYVQVRYEVAHPQLSLSCRPRSEHYWRRRSCTKKWAKWTIVLCLLKPKSRSWLPSVMN
jgi:hypothetical protein